MNQREHRFQHWCCEYLDRALLTDVPVWFTSIESGSYMQDATKEQRFAWEGHRKYRGIKPCHLDLYVYQKPLFAQFELKVGTNKLTSGQRVTIRLLRDRDIPTGCAYTLREFHSLLVASGFRLHGNAENILKEVELRLAAAEGRAVTATPPKAKGRPPRADYSHRGDRRRDDALMSEEAFEDVCKLNDPA